MMQNFKLFTVLWWIIIYIDLQVRTILVKKSHPWVKWKKPSYRKRKAVLFLKIVFIGFIAFFFLIGTRGKFLVYFNMTTHHSYTEVGVSEVNMALK